MASVVSVEYVGRGEYFDLTVPIYANYYCASTVHHNSGKTLAAAACVARAITGQDDSGMSPRTGGTMYCVGKEWKEVGQVLFPMLFEEDAFRVIRDKVTGCLRAYRPWDPEDFARGAETEPSPPLVPKRFYKETDISWYNKRQRQPSMVYIEKTDWTVHFYSSAPGSSPVQGAVTHGAWLDEEILDDIWYDELSARLLSKNGWLIWSASPELSTPKYKDLYDRAVKEARNQPDESKRKISAFQLNLLNNPHLDKEAVASFVEKMQDSSRIASKVYGKFAFDSSLVHPEFDEQLFTVPPFDIPENWTLRLAVDPGIQVCGVLFCATPPDDDPVWGGHRILFNELYLERHNAEEYAIQLKENTHGRSFYEFIIDQQGYRISDIGSGRSVGEQYVQQMEKLGIESEITGNGFTFSMKDERSGRAHVKTWLKIMPDALPRLLIMEGRCPNTVREFKRYQLQRSGGKILDKPVTTTYHMMDLCRYLASNGCDYQKPTPKAVLTTKNYYEWLRSSDRERGQKAVIAFGPAT